MSVLFPRIFVPSVTDTFLKTFVVIVMIDLVQRKCDGKIEAGPSMRPTEAPTAVGFPIFGGKWFEV